MDLRDITNLAIATLRVRPWSIEDVLATCQEVDKNISDQELTSIGQTLIEEVINKSSYANRPRMLFNLALKAQQSIDENKFRITIEYYGREIEVKSVYLIPIIKDMLCGAGE